MKVLIIGQFIEPPFSEGVVNVILNWSKAIQHAGADVSILSISSKYTGYKKFYGLDFIYVKTHNPRFQSNLTDLFNLQREIIKQSLQFDIIHYAYNTDGLSSIPMLILLKNKKINSYHNNYLVKSTFLLRNFLLDVVTVPSKRMFKHFIQKHVPSQRMKIISPCVNTDLFRPRDKMEVRKKLNLPNDSFLIFTTGHFKRGRRLLSLIQVIAELLKEHKNILLLIGWTGHGEEDTVREIFSIIKNMEFVKIIPPTYNINLYYNASDVYVMSASSDYVIEFPMSLIEALSSGIPAITFDVNAASEIVINDINGYVIKDGDFNDLKYKLNYMINDPYLMKEFSSNARNMVVNNYSYNVIGNKLLNLYKDMIDVK